jgi:Tfp pilus assembly protein PilO
MPFWGKVGAIVAAVIVIFNAGFFIKGKFEEAAQADILRQQIKAQAEKQDDMKAKAEAAEAVLSALRRNQSDINRKWNQIRAQDPSLCLLGDSRVGLLREATGPAGEAAR